MDALSGPRRCLRRLALCGRDQFNIPERGTPTFNDLDQDLRRRTFRQGPEADNAGLRSDISYVKGHYTLRRSHVRRSFPHEADRLVCLSNVPPICFAINDNWTGCKRQRALLVLRAGCAVARAHCAPCTNLALRLTRGGRSTSFTGHRREEIAALRANDKIATGSWSSTWGFGRDLYRGISQRHSGGARRVLPKLKPTIRIVLGFPTRAHYENSFKESASRGSNLGARPV